MRYLPLVLVVAGNVVYHLGQKTMPTNAPPATATFLAYVVAALTCLALVPIVEPGWSLTAARPALHWSPVLVGLGAVAIELGFLLAYRAQWPISSASLLATSVLALVLVPIGVFGFGEGWSWSRTLGLALCVSGLWLLRGR